MERSIYRGQVYYVDFGSSDTSVQSKRRPAVVVSNNLGNQYSSIVIVAPFTSKPKKELPTHLDVVLPKVRGTILCEQLRTVSKDDVGDYAGCLTQVYLTRLNSALSAALDLDGTLNADAPDLSKQELDDQIKRCEELQQAYLEQVEILRYMSGKIDTELPKNPIKTPPSIDLQKKAYRKRSQDEVDQFVAEWESGIRTQDMLKKYGFTNLSAAQVFYRRHR